MKKQIRTLIILLVVAGLLVGGVFIAKKIKEKAEAPEETENRERAFSVAAETITKVSWEYAGREPMTVEKQADGTWKLSDEPETPLDETKIQSILYGISDVPIYQEITSGAPEDFGFTEPTNRVSVTAGGETTEFVFGRKNSMETKYYMLYDGHTYLVELFENNVFDMDRKEMYKEKEESDGSGTFETTTADPDEKY